MRVAIVGSRELTRRSYVERAMARAARRGIVPTVVLCGEARGPDRIGREWAEARWIAVDSYPADWRSGRGAGLARNIRMAQACDAVVAIWDGHSRGTAHMIEQARKLGRKLYILQVSV